MLAKKPQNKNQRKDSPKHNDKKNSIAKIHECLLDLKKRMMLAYGE
jgi:hypothetical protein